MFTLDRVGIWRAHFSAAGHRLGLHQPQEAPRREQERGRDRASSHAEG